jgi:hypothetical protein
MKLRFKFCPEEADEGAAGSEPEEGDTDDQIGEVMPVLNGKELHEENLIADDNGGNEENGGLDSINGQG